MTDRSDRLSEMATRVFSGVEPEPPGTTRCETGGCARLAYLSTSEKCIRCRRNQPADVDGTVQTRLLADGGQPHAAPVDTASGRSTDATTRPAGDDDSQPDERTPDDLDMSEFWRSAPKAGYDEDFDVQFVHVTRTCKTVHLVSESEDGSVSETPRCSESDAAFGRTARTNGDDADYRPRSVPIGHYDDDKLCRICCSFAQFGDDSAVLRGPVGGDGQ